MEDYLRDIENWMAQVRDEEVEVEDYDFLERLSHGGSSNNGNNGLANVGAYLAIYNEDGQIIVDEELVDALDEQQANKYSGRKRFRNIVHDAQTQKREDNTLEDREVDGHEVLQTMIEEFRSNADIESRGDAHMTEKNEDNSYDEVFERLDTLGGYALAIATGPINLPATMVGVGVDYLMDEEESRGTSIEVSEGEGQNDTISSKPENEQPLEGGDKFMDYGPEDLVRNLAAKTNTTRRERSDTLEALNEYKEENELTIDEMDSLLEATIERYEDSEELEQDTYGAIQDWADEGIDYLKEVREDMEGAYDWLDVIDTLHDTGRRDVERFRDENNLGN